MTYDFRAHHSYRLRYPVTAESTNLYRKRHPGRASVFLVHVDVRGSLHACCHRQQFLKEASNA